MPDATLICVDNSEWMRNGDYTPYRLEAQADAVNLVAAAKLESHPESTVALMTFGGRSPQVLCTLTTERTRIMSALPTIKLSGDPDVISGLHVAMLALKHRQDKNQRQRIVLFVGSPITVEAAQLVQLGKKLKKNNVSVDVVSFGEEAQNKEKLEAFINAVNSGDSSHLFSVPPGPHLLSDVLLNSPILAGEQGGVMAGLAASRAGGDANFIDPNLDPELALALRLSLEEERARMAAADASSGGSSNAAPAATPSAAPAAFSYQDEEERLLQEALALSLSEVGGGPAPSAPAAASDAMDVEGAGDEEEELRQALAMSMGATSADISAMLSSLSGVDPNSPEVQEALKKLDKKPEDDNSK